MYEISLVYQVMDQCEVTLTDKSILEIQRELTSSVNSLEEMDIHRQPSISPRVGDEYQVELPPLITEAEYRQCTQKLNYRVNNYAIKKELDIPVVCTLGEVCQNVGEGKDSDKSTHARNNETIYLKDISLSDAELDGFLLGLYIFGKNFTLIHKFMEDNTFGNVISFYYGKFYGSAAYRRWVESKKLRSRRCISGNRLFSGWRQQELLSRLFNKVPDQSKDTLKEVAMKFNHCTVSLEEFVFQLKGIVGLHVLIEAIAVGKGKHDLTRINTDPVKANNVQSLRSEISKGKIFCSLTSEDIITYLTGNFRLSKMQLSDLFWESVWPLLLARGWHSEQPNGQSFITSHNSLVFLFPGVKKFSRRELVKGMHYFDSVSDVLDKVASEPMLLELEAGGDEENNAGTVDKKDTRSVSDQNGSSQHEDSFFLRPASVNDVSNLCQFTVVDTSYIQGEAPLCFRKLRSLPVDKNEEMLPFTNPTHTTDTNSSVKSQDHADVSSTNEVVLNSQTRDENEMGNIKITSGETKSTHYCQDAHVQNEKSKYKHDLDCEPKSLLDEMRILKIQKNQLKCDKLTYLDEKQGKFVKIRKEQVKSDKQTYLSHASKRRKPTTFTEVESGCDTYPFSGKKCMKGEADHQFKRSVTDGGLSDKPGKFLSKCKNSRMDVPRECSIIQSNGHSLQDLGSKKVLSDRKRKHNLSIDLNSSQCSSDSYRSEGDVDMFTTVSTISSLPLEKEQTQANRTCNELTDEKKLTMNSRRQGTRNRPPTARVLEAVASGYLGPGQRIRSPRRASSRYSHCHKKTGGSFTINGSTTMQINTVVNVDQNCGRCTSETISSSSLHDHSSSSNSQDSPGVLQVSDHGQTFIHSYDA